MRTPSLRTVDYRALADFRFEIRRFLHFSERLVHAAGVEPQQHQALLAIKGLPAHRVATIGVLAERLLIQHHSAVELANRLQAKGLLRRARSAADRREVVLTLSPRGETLLQRLTRPHRKELQSARPRLLTALTAAIDPDTTIVRAKPSTPRKKHRNKRRPKLKRKIRRANAPHSCRKRPDGSKVS
ncbi:MAG TPA: helix-turn-helix domain-containing protein [Candidatus Acidoferrales bacterium]|nr:helix-turn-helix domain-containing protein [Candidatus Acidoferrales bacterium]